MSNIKLGKFVNYSNTAILDTEDRKKHLYVVGKSGTGKSTLLQNIFLQDVYQLGGVCLIDPHGDLAEEVLKQIPKQRLNDVLYINLADIDFPIKWNPLQKISSLHEYFIPLAFVQALKNIWADSWGARMEYILFNALFILTAANGTLVMLPKLFTNEKFRQNLLKHVKDPKIKYFWNCEYPQIIKEFPEALMPIENKVGKILSQKNLRHLFSSRTSSFDFRHALDNQKIIIVNLAQGRIGKEVANLFGSIFVSLLTEAAMSRCDLPPNKRTFFSFIIDEFQMFTTESFDNMLSGIRKYGVGLTLAHQYVDQLSETISNAIYGNVGNKVIFAVGSNDAEKLKRELHGYSASAIYELENYQAFFTRGDGFVARIKTEKPLSPKDEGLKLANSEKIISENRKKFAGKREDIESDLAKFFKNISKTGKSGYSYIK